MLREYLDFLHEIYPHISEDICTYYKCKNVSSDRLLHLRRQITYIPCCYKHKFCLVALLCIVDLYN